MICCLCFYTFRPIWIKFSAGYVNKNMLSDSELHVGGHSESLSLLRVVNEFLNAKCPSLVKFGARKVVPFVWA